jgi:hypothetical protein
MQLQVAGDIDELLHEEKWCEADQKVVNAAPDGPQIGGYVYIND